MRNEFEVRVEGLKPSKPRKSLRRRQPGAMREVDGYGVRDMANATVLVFEGSVVPVARSLESERHHNNGQKYGQNPTCDVRPIQQICKAPLPMLLSCKKVRNSRPKSCKYR
jgi:hypothetical protein